MEKISLGVPVYVYAIWVTRVSTLVASHLNILRPDWHRVHQISWICGFQFWNPLKKKGLYMCFYNTIMGVGDLNPGYLRWKHREVSISWDTNKLLQDTVYIIDTMNHLSFTVLIFNFDQSVQVFQSLWCVK